MRPNPLRHDPTGNTAVRGIVADTVRHTPAELDIFDGPAAGMPVDLRLPASLPANSRPRSDEPRSGESKSGCPKSGGSPAPPASATATNRRLRRRPAMCRPATPAAPMGERTVELFRRSRRLRARQLAAPGGEVPGHMPGREPASATTARMRFSRTTAIGRFPKGSTAAGPTSAPWPNRIAARRPGPTGFRRGW